MRCKSCNVAMEETDGFITGLNMEDLNQLCIECFTYNLDALVDFFHNEVFPFYEKRMIVLDQIFLNETWGMYEMVDSGWDWIDYKDQWHTKPLFDLHLTC